MTYIKILKKLDANIFLEDTPPWHCVLDLSYFDNDKLVSIQDVANQHSISESDVLHNASELLFKNLITLVEVL